MSYTQFQNIHYEWNEEVEKIVLGKNNISVNTNSIIAFRSMLELGLNSLEVLEEQIRFVKCFYVYSFKSDSLLDVQSDIAKHWNHSVIEYDDCMRFDACNFYRINGKIYYIDW